MASIIAPADFTGQNNIPDKDLVGENLQGFIDKYEPLFLSDLLGDDLYKAYKLAPTEARFTALLPYFKPAVVDYVYWFWMEDQQIQTLGTGTGQTKKENAVTASPWPKMVRAWNEMVEYNKKTNKFLKDNADYPEYTIVLPTWYYNRGFYPAFDWNWYLNFGEYCLPKIYRLQNRLGI